MREVFNYALGVILVLNIFRGQNQLIKGQNGLWARKYSIINYNFETYKFRTSRTKTFCSSVKESSNSMISEIVGSVVFVSPDKIS